MNIENKFNYVLVGGTFNDNKGKESGIVKKLFNALGTFNSVMYNGGNYSDLINNVLPSIKETDLTIWMTDIDNTKEKVYPKKQTGSVLICSKVMRDGYTIKDAVSRIFKMHGNAVIAIYKNEDTKMFTFSLYDALANCWYEGTDIEKLALTIYSFYIFSKGSIRKQTARDTSLISYNDNRPDDLNDFIELNNSLADFIQTSCGDRFFGNLSTRCQKLFPSERCDKFIYVSPRNVDKNRLTPSDFVLFNTDDYTYYSVDEKIKPSVDSPVQAEIYKEFPTINYMIHGHAFIDVLKEADENNIPCVSTENYFPCGDLRELTEVKKHMKSIIYDVCHKNYGIINLKGHGFLMFSQTLEQMKYMINDIYSFKMNDGKQLFKLKEDVIKSTDNRSDVENHVQNSTVQTSDKTDEANKEGVNQVILNRLRSFLERCMEDGDYIKLKNAVNSDGMKVIPDEVVRFQAAYATLKSINLNLTKDNIIYSIDTYISDMNDQYNIALKQIKEKRKVTVEVKKKIHEEKAQKIAMLQNEIVELSVEMKKLSDEIKEGEIECDKYLREFADAVNVIISALESDKKKISENLVN